MFKILFLAIIIHGICMVSYRICEVLFSQFVLVFSLWIRTALYVLITLSGAKYFLSI